MNVRRSEMTAGAAFMPAPASRPAPARRRRRDRPVLPCRAGGVLGDGVRLISHVSVAGAPRSAPATRIFPFASIGHEPQDLKYRGEPVRLTIGEDCLIREGVTMNPGTAAADRRPRRRRAASFSPTPMSRMIAGSATTSSCRTTSCSAAIARSAISRSSSGGAAAHQFVRIGAHAFVGGLAGVENDVIPYGIALGNRAALAGLNIVGLKRRGFSREAIHDLRRAYKMLFAAKGTLKERVEDVAAEFAGRCRGAADRRFPARGRRARDLHAARGQGRGRVSRPARRRGARRRRARSPSSAAPALFRSRSPKRRGARAAIPFSSASSAPPIPRSRAIPHLWVRLGEVGKLFAALKARDVAEIALIGAIARPEFADLRLDWGAVRRAGELAKLFRGGDNTLLSGIAGIFEREGAAGRRRARDRPAAGRAAGARRRRGGPRRRAGRHRRALDLLDALAPFDVGQGAVVADDRVLAIEAAEGTDAMLARVGELRAARPPETQGSRRRLGQSAKRGQELPARHAGDRSRHDRRRAPGPNSPASRWPLGKVLIAERETVARAADAAGLFVVGFAA